MTFGEKVKAERTKLGLNQDELAEKIGVTRRVICSYENDKSRPRGTERYKKLAEALNVNVNYLLSENEEFVLQAKQTYGYQGARDAEELIADISALFAGGELSEDAKDGVMRALQDAYWMAKEKNREKYTPKKYRNKSDGE
jgi:transcriptional regulator with XRE-family HTH domain